ncbi:MAG: hypothetical protein NTV31_08680 [Bacteroidia bacterium]|nr:hypothetical protein [Bacteroidia bacterium]
MNRLFTKRIGALVSALIIISTVSFSQIDNVDFMRCAPADVAKLLQAYVSPWTNAFGAGLNGGWYNTAKPHKLGGFDITTSFNLAFVPSSADKFDISKLGLSSSLTGTGTTSTISGPKTSGPPMTYNANGVTLASFNAPPGTGWKLIPVPTAQIGIGLPLGTELKGRFIPKISYKDGNISLWGIGLVHSIMQYVPGNELLPFDVSLFGGYTKLKTNVPLGLQPETTIAQNYSSPFSSASSFNNQNLSIIVSALNISAIASLNLPVVTFYGGIGYCKTKTQIEFTGNFPIPVLVTPALPAVPYPEYNNSGVKTSKDFPKMNIENFSGMRANIGLRLKFSVITIHVDYTRAQYNVVSTGFGISFR